MPTAHINGQTLFFTDTGPEDGTLDKPAIIFSHGLLMNHTMFAAQITALRQTYRCIAWDERGHGRTNDTSLFGPFTYWDSADDLAGLLTHLGIHRAILAGMSQGGFLSLRAALRYPKMVRALILLDTQAGAEAPDAQERNTIFAQMWVQEGATDFLLDSAEQIIIGPNYADINTWRDYWRQFPPANFAACVNTLHGREDLTPQLPNIHAPALIVHGDADAAIPLEKAEQLAAGLRAKLAVIPGGGHAANMTHAALVNAEILVFLASLPA